LLNIERKVKLVPEFYWSTVLEYN